MGASKDINFGNRDLSSSLAQSSSDQCHHKTCYNTTTFLISSASGLQRLPEATRNSVLTCLRSQFSARTPSMSSRKSARISAASLEAQCAQKLLALHLRSKTTRFKELYNQCGR